MAKTHKEQQELAKKIEQAKTKIDVGAEYWHYKGQEKVYKVLSLGFIEATNELCVIYQSQYGEQLTFIRPLNIWLEMVEWNGELVPRFNTITS